MDNNKEIMDMLKVILEKVERLENIHAENVDIESGSITINCENSSAISIETAEDIVIQAIGKCPISIENAENVEGDNLEKDE